MLRTKSGLPKLKQDWGKSSSVLQSALWAGDLQVGAQMLRGIAGRSASRLACPGSDRHSLISSLGTRQGQGDFHSGEAAIR
jgi:hypothetical protein